MSGGRQTRLSKRLQESAAESTGERRGKAQKKRRTERERGGASTEVTHCRGNSGRTVKNSHGRGGVEKVVEDVPDGERIVDAFGPSSDESDRGSGDRLERTHENIGISQEELSSIRGPSKGREEDKALNADDHNGLKELEGTSRSDDREGDRRSDRHGERRHNTDDVNGDSIDKQTSRDVQVGTDSIHGMFDCIMTELTGLKKRMAVIEKHACSASVPPESHSDNPQMKDDNSAVGGSTGDRRRRYEEVMSKRVNGLDNVFGRDEVGMSMSYSLIRLIMSKSRDGPLSSRDGLHFLSLMTNSNGLFDMKNMKEEQVALMRLWRKRTAQNAIFHARHNTWSVYDVPGGDEASAGMTKPKWLQENPNTLTDYLTITGIEAGCRRCDDATVGAKRRTCIGKQSIEASAEDDSEYVGYRIGRLFGELLNAGRKRVVTHFSKTYCFL